MEETSEKEKRTKIIIGVVVALAACFFIPYSHWDTEIVSGRLMSEATIVDKGQGFITVRLFTMTPSDDMVETDTFLLLEGYIPKDAHIGQRVKIGYSYDSLYKHPNQSVQVSYYVKGNLMTGFILKMLNPFQSAETDLRIADIQSDGSLLAFNRAS